MLAIGIAFQVVQVGLLSSILGVSLNLKATDTVIMIY
jgi:hypothetical protein